VSSKRDRFSAGDRFGEYEVLRKTEGSSEGWWLGGGGFGDTYKARHIHMDAIVALKVLKTEAVDDKAYRRFVQEAKVLKDLNHPHIAKFEHMGVAHERAYFTMEFCDGGDLGRISSLNKGLPPVQVLVVARQCCEALIYAHNKNLIHRDIKPDNLMLGQLEDGSQGVKLIDFGLARVFGGGSFSAHLSSGAPEGFAGTPTYASPEQIREAPDLDARTDLYSLGVALLFVAFGKLPQELKGKSRRDVQEFHCDLRLPFSVSGLDPILEPVIKRLVAKDKHARFRDAAEALKVIDQQLAGVEEVFAGQTTTGSIHTTIVSLPLLPVESHPTSPLTGTSAARSLVQSGITFNEHYPTGLTPDGWSTPVGPTHAARTNEGAEVAVTLLGGTELDAGLRDEVNHLVNRHLALGKSRDYPPSLIRPLRTLWLASGETVVESELVEGFPIQTILRARHRVGFAELLDVLGQIAESIDFSLQEDLPYPALGDSQILISFLAGGAEYANLWAQKPLDQGWPEYRVRLSPLRLLRVGNRGLSFPYSDPSGSMHNAAGGDDTVDARNPVAAFAAKIYRFVSGAPVADAAFLIPNAFRSVAGLSKEGNELLRSAIASERAQSGGARGLLDALCRTEGLTPAPPPPPTSSGGSTPTPVITPPEPPPPPLPQDKGTNHAPGIVRSPFKNRVQVKLEGYEWTEHKPLRCPETEREFRLPDRPLSMTAEALADEPGFVLSPYYRLGDPRRRVWIQPRFWEAGQTAECTSSGFEMRLPDSLPYLLAGVERDRPGLIISPYEASDNGHVPPDQWAPNEVVKLGDKLLRLPSELPEPKTVQVRDVNEVSGTVRTPYGKTITILDEQWKPGRLVSCESGLLFRLPRDLPPRRHVAGLVDGHLGIISNPFTGERLTIPGEEWVAGSLRRCPETGQEFELPDPLPSLKAQPRPDKPGWFINPYLKRQSFHLEPHEWQPGREIRRESHIFLLPSRLPELPEARFEGNEFGRIASPHAAGFLVNVNEADWRPGKILLCPESQCLFRLPSSLPVYKGLAQVIEEQCGFQGCVQMESHLVMIPGERWVGGAEIQSPTGKVYQLPKGLPPLAGKPLPDSPGFVLSPYTPGASSVKVLPENWVVGQAVDCPVSKRQFLLPTQLPYLLGDPIPERPGEVRSPFDPTHPILLKPEEWASHRIISGRGRTFQLPDLSSLPPLPEAGWSKADKDYGHVRSPHSGKPMAVAIENWHAGKILDCAETGLLFRMPANLQPQPVDGELVVEQISFQGAIRSPYPQAQGAVIRVNGGDWIPGSILECPETGRHFRIPQVELPPLQARQIPGKPGSVESPYAPGTEQTISGIQWRAGAAIPCDRDSQHRTFVLPKSDLTKLFGKPDEKKVGEIASPYAQAFVQVSPSEWRPGQSVICPQTKLAFLLPDPLPVPPAGELVNRDFFGEILSPYAPGAAPIEVTEVDWTPGKLLACRSTGCLFTLPEKLPEWLRDGRVDALQPSPKGIAHSPYAPVQVEVSGPLWNPLEKILCPVSRRHFQLPLTLPPLTAVLVEPGKGLVQSPYREHSALVAVKPQEWQASRTIWCRESEKEFRLPDDLPPLEAVFPGGAPGSVISPYSETSFEVNPPDWKAGGRVTCPSSGKPLTLPGNLPEPPVAEMPTTNGLVLSPYSRQNVPVEMRDWLDRQIIRCPQTRSLFSLPEGLPVWAQEGAIIAGVAGRIISPYGLKAVADVSGPDWEAGNLIPCSATPGKFIRLPQDLPPMEAMVRPEEPGTILSPYDAAGRPLTVAAAQWESGGLTSCPATRRPLRLPRSLPALVAVPDRAFPGLVTSPYAPEKPFPVAPAQWRLGERLTCPATGRPLVLPSKEDALPSPRSAKQLDRRGARAISPYDAKAQKIDLPIWEPGALVTCPFSGALFQLPASLEPAIGEPDLTTDHVIESAAVRVRSPYGKREWVNVPATLWQAGGEVPCPETHRPFQLPASLPPMRAGLLDSGPGMISSPYAPGKPCKVPCRDWIADSVFECPHTHRPLRLPAQLPPRDEAAELKAERAIQSKRRLRNLLVAGTIAFTIIVSVSYIAWDRLRDPEGDAWKRLMATGETSVKNGDWKGFCKWAREDQQAFRDKGESYKALADTSDHRKQQEQVVLDGLQKMKVWLEETSWTAISPESRSSLISGLETLNPSLSAPLLVDLRTGQFLNDLLAIPAADRLKSLQKTFPDLNDPDMSALLDDDRETLQEWGLEAGDQIRGSKDSKKLGEWKSQVASWQNEAPAGSNLRFLPLLIDTRKAWIDQSWNVAADGFVQLRHQTLGNDIYERCVDPMVNAFHRSAVQFPANLNNQAIQTFIKTYGLGNKPKVPEIILNPLSAEPIKPGQKFKFSLILLNGELNEPRLEQDLLKEGSGVRFIGAKSSPDKPGGRELSFEATAAKTAGDHQISAFPIALEDLSPLNSPPVAYKVTQELRGITPVPTEGMESQILVRDAEKSTREWEKSPSNSALADKAAKAWKTAIEALNKELEAQPGDPIKKNDLWDAIVTSTSLLKTLERSSDLKMQLRLAVDHDIPRAHLELGLLLADSSEASEKKEARRALGIFLKEHRGTATEAEQQAALEAAARVGQATAIFELVEKQPSVEAKIQFLEQNLPLMDNQDVQRTEVVSELNKHRMELADRHAQESKKYASQKMFKEAADKNKQALAIYAQVTGTRQGEARVKSADILKAGGETADYLARNEIYSLHIPRYVELLERAKKENASGEAALRLSDFYWDQVSSATDPRLIAQSVISRDENTRTAIGLWTAQAAAAPPASLPPNAQDPRAKALIELARIHTDPKRFPEDYFQAGDASRRPLITNYLKQAAEMGDPEGLYLYGYDFMEKGDLTNARQFMSQAQAKGYPIPAVIKGKVGL
jgi:serine/threonine protein kinase